MVQQIEVPHVNGCNFGVAVDLLSGTLMNLAVTPATSPPKDATGSDYSFQVTRVTTTEELQRNLGIDASASYGTFGAGVSARFHFAEQASVHSASLFMTITSFVVHDLLAATPPGQPQPREEDSR